MFKLTKEAERVYLLAFDNRIDLCMTFLRYQEYYESDNKRFQHHRFTIAEYVSWYSKKDTGRKKYPHHFTYAADWVGFNFPTRVIDQVIKLGIPDPNHYDSLMAGILGAIKDNAQNDDCYLIGIQTGQTATLEHEMAHALYFLDEDYRVAVGSLIEALPTEIHDRMAKGITRLGYADSSVNDEIQAFSLTGSRPHLWKGKPPHELALFYKKLEALYERRRLTKSKK